MLEISQILARLLIALVVGALMGLERETAGKEAGIRTEMLVSAGSALYTMIALMLPYLFFIDYFPQANLEEIIARNSGFMGIIANIVVGIGFLGAGIIIKNRNHVYGLTTAALVWATSAIGIMTGLGLWQEAIVSAFMISGLLFLLRRLDISPGSA